MTDRTKAHLQKNRPSKSMRSLYQPRFTRLQLEAEKARRQFYEFVRQAWRVLEQETPFVDGMHVHAICEHLQAVSEGRIRNLIINVPPGHGKSLLIDVFWPAWVWIDHPEIGR